MRHKSPEEVERAVSAVNRQIAGGRTVAQACEAAGVSIANFYRWRRHSPGPEDPPKVRKAIVDAAKVVFFRDGYLANLESVATEAGVARQTVYNQFGSKKELFGEVLREVYSRLYQPVVLIANTDDVAQTLGSFATALMRIVLDPESIALTRIGIAAYSSDPELARISYELRAANVVPTFAKQLAAYLAQEAARGVIRDMDAAAVAESFFGACMGSARHHALMGVQVSEDSPENIAARLAGVVEIFARGLQPA